MPPARHLCQHHAEGKQVGSRIERPPFQLFRRHVVGRADDHSLGRQLRFSDRASGSVGRNEILDPLGKPEVHHLHMALLGEHDVGGLQVAVQKPDGMRFQKRLGNLAGHANRLRQRHGTLEQPVMQGGAGDVLHHQEQFVAVCANFEDLADVWVIQRSDGQRFAAKTLPRLAVGRHPCRQELDGDLAFEPGIPGAIHLAHAARAKWCNDFIDAEAGAGNEGQVAWIIRERL